MAPDWDQIFQYRSHKVVRILDFRLGILYNLCILATLVYVVVYEAILKQGYLVYDDATGSTHCLLLNPHGGFAGLAERPYCHQGGSCELWDEHDVRYPNEDTAALLLTSRVTECEQRLVCNESSSAQNATCPRPSPYSNPGCSDAKDPDTKTFFVAGLEDFIFEVNHTVVAPELYSRSRDDRFLGNSIAMRGSVISYTGAQKRVMREMLPGVVDKFTVHEMTDSCSAEKWATVVENVAGGGLGSETARRRAASRPAAEKGPLAPPVDARARLEGLRVGRDGSCTTVLLGLRLLRLLRALHLGAGRRAVRF